MSRVVLKQLEILRIIVLLIPIFVVDHFIRQEKPPEDPFHHQSVLEDVVGVLPGVRVTLLMNQDIAVLVHQPAFPCVVALSSVGAP